MPVAEEIQARLVRFGARTRVAKALPEPWKAKSFVANGLFFSDKLAAVIAEDQELGWILAASIKTARRASI